MVQVVQARLRWAGRVRLELLALLAGLRRYPSLQLVSIYQRQVALRQRAAPRALEAEVEAEVGVSRGLYFLL